jgi:hypothetical protein
MADVARPDTVFAIAGLSAPIDHYYTSPDARVSLARPGLASVATVRTPAGQVLQAQGRARQGSTTVCMVLLDIAYNAGKSRDRQLSSSGGGCGEEHRWIPSIRLGSRSYPPSTEIAWWAWTSTCKRMTGHTATRRLGSRKKLWPHPARPAVWWSDACFKCGMSPTRLRPRFYWMERSQPRLEGRHHHQPAANHGIMGCHPAVIQALQAFASRKA